jgi:hypothetical protein
MIDTEGYRVDLEKIWTKENVIIAVVVIGVCVVGLSLGMDPRNLLERILVMITSTIVTGWLIARHFREKPQQKQPIQETAPPQRIQPFQETVPPRRDLSTMEVLEFELFVTELLGKLGFNVLYSGDTSMIAVRGTEVFVVQCHHSLNMPVERSFVKETHLASLKYKKGRADDIVRGAVVTSGRFSPHAKEYAAQKNVWLVNFRRLQRMAAQCGIMLVGGSS